jgi:hypothetical protein
MPTDLMKLRVAFRNIATVAKNDLLHRDRIVNLDT